MSIQMIGVDHTKAPIDVRTVFSFTKKQIGEAMEAWKNIPGLHGCVIISTCNRMELWASMDEECGPDLYEMLAANKEVIQQDYEKYIVRRSGKEAAEHLFELSSGLQSRILGEDQIITQVKDALSLARENYATDNVLEVLFRMAVTAAKKVKTEIVLSDANSSVAHQAIKTLRRLGHDFRGKKCMVIGNGEMGKISAGVFRDAGADVTVTVRRYRSGVVDIPRDCERIDYAKRMELFPDCDYVVSATASPNYTLTAPIVQEAKTEHPVTIIDLAVPRDVDPAICEIEGITVYDIDYFTEDHISEQTKENIAEAKKILQTQLAEFFDWYEGRDLIEMVQRIKEKAVEDFHLRTQKQVREFANKNAMAQEETFSRLNALEEYMDLAVGKVLNKMLFGLRGQVNEQTFRACMEALEKTMN